MTYPLHARLLVADTGHRRIHVSLELGPGSPDQPDQLNWETMEPVSQFAPRFSAVAVESVKLGNGRWHEASSYAGAGLAVLSLTPPDALAPGWTPALVEALVGAARDYHLNDMQGPCIHQWARGWKPCGGHHGNVVHLDPPGGSLRGCDYYTPTRANWHAGTRPEDRGVTVFREAGRHYWYEPGAVAATYCEDAVGRRCGQCGYRAWTAWLYKPIPKEVRRFLEDLPGIVGS